MMVLAPGRLSTTICWPRSSPIFWPMRRPRKSAGAPGADGKKSGVLRAREGFAAAAETKSASNAAAQASRPAFTRLADWRITFSRIDVPHQPAKPRHRWQWSEHGLKPLEATPQHRLVAVDDRLAQRALDLVDRF